MPYTPACAQAACGTTTDVCCPVVVSGVSNRSLTHSHYYIISGLIQSLHAHASV
jgi:hypothetical protein